MLARVPIGLMALAVCALCVTAQDKAVDAGDTVPPVLLKQVNPKYDCPRVGLPLKGQVLIRFHVNEKGKVEQVTVIKTLEPGLDQAAVEAVKKYQFKPAMKAGIPVNVQLFSATSFECQ